MGPYYYGATDAGSSEVFGPGYFMGQGLNFISTIITLLFAGGTIGMTVEAARTGRTSASTGFDTISDKFIGILAVGIIFQIAVTIGICFCIIPGVLFCYWWLFAMTILVVEGVGIGDAFSRSKEFAEGRKTFGFSIAIVIVMFLLALAVVAVQFMVMLPLMFIIGFWGAIVVGSLISALLSWFISPLSYIWISWHYLKGSGRVNPRFIPR
jgi:hypothetical protein